MASTGPRAQQRMVQIPISLRTTAGIYAYTFLLDPASAVIIQAHFCCCCFSGVHYKKTQRKYTQLLSHLNHFHMEYIHTEILQNLSTGIQLDSDIHSCKLSNQITKHIWHRYNVNLSTITTHPTLPLWLNFRQSRLRRWSFLQHWRQYTATCLADATLRLKKIQTNKWERLPPVMMGEIATNNYLGGSKPT